jgi:FixJ family two-component response regulator
VKSVRPRSGPALRDTKEQEMVPQAQIVAVVEDDASMMTGIERLLWAHGFGTEAYASAEAYLDHAAASKATCLVIDIHLSGISGIELRRRLAASGSTQSVIFMTAVDNELTRKEAMAAGCIAYLPKPFPANLLLEAVGKAAGSA